MVIGCRGSDGSRHSGTGAGPAIDSRPWRTRIPTRALTTDLATDHESIGVSGP